MISADAKPQLAGLSVTGGRLNADRAVVAVNGPLPAPDSRADSRRATATPEPPVATPTPVPPAPPVDPRGPGRHADADGHADRLPVRRHASAARCSPSAAS